MQSEEERLRDQREREELEEHLRERDASGTRKVHHIFDDFDTPLTTVADFISEQNMYVA